jgi:predicted hydrocarbon binding protein
MPKYVECPDSFAPLFEAAEAAMEPTFRDQRWDPAHGALLVGGERYVMYRSRSMAIHLREELERVVGPAADSVIYRFGKACGAADADYYFSLHPEAPPPLRLALGPVVFALGGYAVVKVLPESAPSPDEDYLLVYEHPNSYEADAYSTQGLTSPKPVCYLNSGYSAGWCGKAFGLTLEAKEVSCRAKGDPFCRFVMAPPSRLRQRVAEMCEAWNLVPPK